MKKFKKTVFSLSMILFYANSAYATTTGRYVASESNANSGKMLMLLVALGLVALVLFIGYKMDKNEAQEKRKEQIIKNSGNDNKENDYNSKIRVSELEKENTEYVQNDEEYMRQYKKASEETAVLQPLTYNFEETEDNSYEEMEEEFVATYEIHKENEIVESNTEVSDSTMVFDTTSIKEVETEEESILPNTTVKKYTRKKVEKEVEEKPKTAKKATTKKAASTKTTKSTTKKTTTKTAKAAKKEVEEKPKAEKKSTTKKATSTKTTKSTTKKATTKSAPKTTKTVKKEAEEKPKAVKKATTKKASGTKTAKKSATKK